MTREQARQVAIAHATATVENLRRIVGTRKLSDEPTTAKVQQQYLDTLAMWEYILGAVGLPKPLTVDSFSVDCQCTPEYICHQHRKSLK